MTQTRKRIDWEAVRSRLSESEAGFGKALVSDPARLEAIFARRAHQLAGRGGHAGPDPATLTVLVFELATERYALNISDVAEAFPLLKGVVLPGAHPALWGVVNRHGEIRPVVELAHLLGLPARDKTAGAGYVLLLRGHARKVGVRVDRIEQIQPARREELTVPQMPDGHVSSRYVQGLTADRVILLNAESILSHPLFQEVTAE